MPRSIATIRARVGPVEHPLAWLAEPLREEPDFELKSWFGGRTIMLRGRHQLYLTVQGEPWQGVLVCTEHEHQAALRAEFAALAPHPILKKWLYLPEAHEQFESVARRLVERVRLGDARIGIAPQAGKARGKRGVQGTGGAKRRAVRFGDAL
jgi:hypothetical protein